MKIKVMGMTCQNCVRHVKQAAENVAGVEMANVDLATGIVVIDGESFDREAVREAIREEGYQVE